MTTKVSYLKREAIAHLVRAVAGVSGQSSFVMIGTGAVIAQLKHIPLDLMRTREIDIYPRGVPDAEELSTLIDGTLGEGSPFDQTFGYYAHGVGERTACLPDGWEERAIRFDAPGLAGVVCLCPEVNDIALSKICAWREKDRVWLEAGINTGVLSLDAMKARSRAITNPHAPDAAEIDRRITSAEEGAGRHRRPPSIR